ncbi:hypothetical protein Pfo_005381 [Paulownia fortunei]|nr:hypothetical protein Pfo_005381 [Paulownia fortunei]
MELQSIESEVSNEYQWTHSEPVLFVDSINNLSFFFYFHVFNINFSSYFLIFIFALASLFHSTATMHGSVLSQLVDVEYEVGALALVAVKRLFSKYSIFKRGNAWRFNLCNGTVLLTFQSSLTFNCIFSFTSFGVKLYKELGMMVYHDLPRLIPKKMILILYDCLQHTLLFPLENRGSEVGKRIVLHVSFSGNPRDMHHKYLDALALVQRFGKSDLFIIMTCNLEWKEIQEKLYDRDYHTLIYLILKFEYKITTLDHFDRFSCLQNILMHGSCGDKNLNNSCMVDVKCKDGYPVYRRRKWVIPYNPYLLSIYNKAMWRNYEFNLNDIYPIIINLQIHLRNHHHEATPKRGLLESDLSVNECQNEVITFQMPHELRRPFATIMVYCASTHVRVLWNIYFETMFEYFKRKSETSHGKNISSYDLPNIYIDIDNMDNDFSREIQDKISVEIPPKDYEYDIFFIKRLGGTGKTFLYSALLAYLRSKNLIALATTTSRVVISIDGNESSECIIFKQSGAVELSCKSQLFLWDEAPMVK